jgi:DNA-binding MarR family transcriptional regulator
MADSAERRPPGMPYPVRARSEAGAAAIAGLQSLSDAVHDADEQALRKLRMRSTDALALMHLVQAAQREDFLTPTRLARLLKVSSAAITKLIDRLVSAGQVERRPNPGDRRGTVLVPVGSAVEDVAQAYGHVYGPVVEVMDELTDDEAAVVGRFAADLANALRHASLDI